MLYAVSSIHPVHRDVELFFTFSGDQCCQRSSVALEVFLLEICWNEKMLHDRGGDWNVYIYIFMFIFYLYIFRGGWTEAIVFFLKALDNVWTKWTWVERKRNDLSFFWHSGPEPFAKDLTIFAAWIASDEYDRTGHLLNVPMNVYPVMNKRHGMSRFGSSGFPFLSRRIHGTVSVGRRVRKNPHADLCGCTGSWS